MANSLQDQLLKAGVVDKKKVNKAKKAKYKQTKQQKGKRQNNEDEVALQAKKVLHERAERDRELNRKKLELEKSKAIAAQVRQLVQLNAIDRQNGDISYHFEHNKIVKKIFVTEDIQKQIVDGILAIVHLEESYEVVPRQVADKIQQRDKNCVVVCNESSRQNEEDGDEYADYKVPDDLMW